MSNQVHVIFLFQELIVGNSQMCKVCASEHSRENFHALNCGHMFCQSCWDMHFQVQIMEGLTTGIHLIDKFC